MLVTTCTNLSNHGAMRIEILHTHKKRSTKELYAGFFQREKFVKNTTTKRFPQVLIRSCSVYFPFT